jgi:hypothetical protein
MQEVAERLAKFQPNIDPTPTRSFGDLGSRLCQQRHIGVKRRFKENIKKLFDECPNLLNSAILFPGWRRRWSHDLLVLRTGSESQSGDENGHDHDHFQKFQSISPPFAAGCFGLFRQATIRKQCFSQLF